MKKEYRCCECICRANYFNKFVVNIRRRKIINIVLYTSSDSKNIFSLRMYVNLYVSRQLNVNVANVLL